MFKRILLQILVIILLVACSSKDKVSKESMTNDNKQVSNSEKIAADYNLAETHVFVKKSAEEIFEASEKKQNFILYLGFPECDWCQALTPTLNEVAIENSIPEIWYWNPREFRGNPVQNIQHHEDYLKMLDLIGLDRPDPSERGVNGISRVSVPFIAVINDGKVDKFDNSPAKLGHGSLMRNAAGNKTSDIEDIRYQDGWIIDKNGDFITAFMWDDLITGYQFPNNFNNRIDWLTINEFNTSRKDSLLKLIRTSKCSSCS